MRDVVKMPKAIASKADMKIYAYKDGGDIEEGSHNLDVNVKS